MVFKRQSKFFWLNKWNICSTNCYKTYTERLFVRINRKSESYFSIISFQSEASRVYISEINIVVFKGQIDIFVCINGIYVLLSGYKTDENLKFTILKLRSEFKVVLIHFIQKTERIFSNFQKKNMGIWKSLYEKSLTLPKGLTFRSDGFRKGIFVSFSDATFWNTYTNIIIIPYLCSHI